MNNDVGMAYLVGLIVILGLYFLPVIVSLVRKTGNAVAVALVCFFFGWTGIGWIIALIMAFSQKATNTVINVQQFAPGGAVPANPSVSLQSHSASPEMPSPPGTSQTTPSSTATTDRLFKLKEMLDTGALTQDEFNKLKADMLGT
jgi:cytoskeletal protein RodZ